MRMNRNSKTAKTLEDAKAEISEPAISLWPSMSDLLRICGFEIGFYN